MPRLVLVVGPSGAGKDTLIAGARSLLADDPRFAFVRRVVTRPADSAEDHEPVSVEDFLRRRADGEFMLDWQAHGLLYAVPKSAMKDAHACRAIVANVSREIVADTVRRFPDTAVIMVSAPPATLSARLSGRGRETEADRAARLARTSPALPDGIACRTVENDRSVEEGISKFMDALLQLADPAAPLPPRRRALPETILTNARLVLENEIVTGSIAFDADGIRGIDASGSRNAAAIDCEGDFVAPGIVEMHTDNFEKHLVPRPKVRWPNALAAAVANDAQMAASGITTVFDAVCAGTYENASGMRKEIFSEEIAALGEASRAGLFRIDHFLHLRCELTDAELPRLVEPHRQEPLLRLVSLMDHTPGHRQWRNPELLRAYMSWTGKSPEEIEATIDSRKSIGQEVVSTNWPIIADMFRRNGIVLASHDDTTFEHVMSAQASGCTISEFPTTVEAARAAHEAGLRTIGGAPNIVRGGSHSGGVAMHTLIAEGLLDGLSSDYVPFSLLQAIAILHDVNGIALAKAFALATWHVADMVGLADRGRLAVGKRADAMRVRFVGRTPLVRRVWSAGEIVF